MSSPTRFVLALCWALGLASLAGASSPTTMKAISYEQYGPASVLEFKEVPRPAPGRNEVLVRVQAAGVNPIDWKLRSGRFRGDPKALPITPGFDIAGTVAALGPGATGFKPGDRVFALLHRQAGYAEYVTVPAGDLVPTPDNTDAAHAAALPTAAQTAWEALFDEGGLKQGQTVLIHGAAGGVGHFAVQLAKAYGAEVTGLPLMLATCLAATAGLAAAGTLYGVLAAGLRVRETLLPILLLPVLAPVLIGATKAFEAALGGVAADGWPWCGLLVTFALLYAIAGTLAFGPLLEED